MLAAECDGMPKMGTLTTRITSNLKRHFKTASIGVFALAVTFLTMACSNNAHALDLGKCDAPRTIMAAAGAEGHGFVAHMNADKVDRQLSKVVKIEQIITATTDGKHWYMLSGNSFKGQSTELCVLMKGVDLEINDNFDNTHPSTTTPLTYIRQDAIDQCKALQKQYGSGLVCNDRDTVLTFGQQQDGQILMLQGKIISPNGGISSMMSLITDPANENDYRVLSTNMQTGATVISQSGTDSGFSPRIMADIQSRRAKQ